MPPLLSPNDLMASVATRSVRLGPTKVPAMTVRAGTETDSMRSSIVAAVQEELNRFSKQVSKEIQRLRDELASERAARVESEATFRSLLPAVEQHLAEFSAQSKRRHEEMNLRIGRMADETNIGLAAAVEAVARPVVKQLEHRQDQLAQDLSALDRSVRKFDEQAGAMVQHFNAMTEATEARLDEVSDQVADQVAEQVDGRLASLSMRLDDVSAQAARQQAEVSNVVAARVDQAEDRINDRIVTAEARVNDSLGQRIADIDAYVGRVSAGLDVAVATISDRVAGAEGRFHEVTASIDALAARLDGVDVDAIDDMKDRLAGAAGEVELVRIEVERFQKSMGESLDKTLGRIVELETKLQEQRMDVETVVQLERLEEVERALIALDPGQFVRREELGPRTSSASPSELDPLTPPTPFQSQASAQL
jgi:hypothetical protein